MNRRHLMNAAVNAMALAALPRGAGAAIDSATQPSWHAQFHAALADRPWLGAYQTASAESFAATATLRGKLPAELRGTLFRNGPAKHEFGSTRLQHWFDGDGMLQAYRLTDHGVAHQARMIETPKYQAEKRAGRPLYSAFGTVVEPSAPVTEPDTINPANISVLPHHGKLYALWEAGSPVAMNPETLATEGVHAFSEHTAGVPFSAHPRVEPDGTLWNFGYISQNNLLVLWHLDPQGTLKNTGLIPITPMSMPHDFVVTERHLVIMIAPLVYTPEENRPQSFLAAHSWQPDQPTRVLVIDKNDLTSHKTYELPAQWVFHFGNAWEDSSGVIRFDGARAPSPAAMTATFREIMRGKQVPAPASKHHLYRIDTRRGQISEEPMLGAANTIETEFPVIDQRVSGRRNQQLVMMSADHTKPTPHGLLNAVSRYRLDNQTLETFTYPISKLPEEHLFVPKPGTAPETEGWVVGSAYDFTSNRTELNVFDANHLPDGPICTALLPYGLPVGLHGKFVS